MFDWEQGGCDYKDTWERTLFELLGRDSLQQNTQKGSEMWNFYSDTEDMALQRLLSCLGNKPL